MGRLFVVGDFGGLGEAVVSDFHHGEVVLDDEQCGAGGVEFALEGACTLRGQILEIFVGEFGDFAGNVERHKVFAYFNAGQDAWGEAVPGLVHLPGELFSLVGICDEGA